MEKIKNRNEVPVEQTWDLTDLFEDVDQYNESLDEVKEKVADFTSRYKGKIETADDVNEALDANRPIMEQIIRISTYSSLDVEADVTNQEKNKRYLATSNDLAELSAELSFLDTDLAQMDADILEEAKEKSSANKLYLEKLLKKKDQLLGAETEAVLAALAPTLEAPYQTYSDIKFGDIAFPNFTVKDKEYEMTYNSFEGTMEQEVDTEVRRQAFDIFYDELDKHKNATASVYNTQVQKEKILSRLRGFDSVFDLLLDRQDVSRNLYDRQIDIIMEKLAPAMRKYAKLLGEIHGLDEVTTADLKIEVDPSYAPHVSYEETRDYIVEGLSVLGEDYQNIVRSAFDDRWIDYAANRGKRTGAFCSSPYGVHPYILTTFNEKMDEVMTLAHELGHAGHFVIAGQNQNLYGTRCSMYFIEAPSTTNEIIMENYLLKQAGDDKRRRRWILSQMISKTYYHNFVTHLLEAAYQREVYKIVDEGGNVTADQLSDIYRKVLEDFWGEEVKVLDGSTLTWMRQPHYYMGLYSYTYSAGLTIGTQMAKRILAEGDEVAQDWIKVLETGGTKGPLELAQMAGVDLSTEEPLLDTIAYISSIIDEIQELTEELKEDEAS